MAGIIGKILGLAKGGTEILNQTTVDKDALIQVKQKLAEMEHLANMASYTSYIEELKAPKDFRTIQRPLWSFICVCGFALEFLTFVGSYIAGMIPKLGFKMEPLVYPMPINIIIMAVVAFYFGGRVLDKGTSNKFFEKWGV